jgi:hypothetical protein
MKVLTSRDEVVSQVKTVVMNELYKLGMPLSLSLSLSRARALSLSLSSLSVDVSI